MDSDKMKFYDEQVKEDERTAQITNGGEYDDDDYDDY